MVTDGASRAPTPVLLAWSGGKDSAVALHALQQDPAWHVVGLVTAVQRDADRVSIHGIRRAILQAQADALALPVVEVPLDAAPSNARYEAAWGDALARARHAVGPVHDLAFGDLFLGDVRAWREGMAQRLGVTPHFPLWGRDTQALAHAVIDAGIEAYLTCVDTTQLAARFVGRRYDAALLAELPATVDPCGERGEFHTVVVHGPSFRWRLPIASTDVPLGDTRFAMRDFRLDVARVVGAASAP